MTDSFLPPELLRMVFAVVCAIVIVFGNAVVMGYLERKLAGRFQRRPGPMEVGWHGILQLAVDGVKLVGKQLVVPRQADKILYRIAPIVSFAPAALPLLVIPFSPKLQGRDFDIGLIFILAVVAINVLAILIAGWGSNNKYSLLGAMRSVAQNVAYEIPMLLTLLSVILVTNTFSLKGIVAAQEGLWFIFLMPVAFLIFFIATVAETNRAPFDLPEAESELTAGFMTEYSGMGFSLFFMAEYTYMFIACSLTVILFLGGWQGPPLPYAEYTSALWFFFKVYALLIIMIWIRWTFPRVRFDQLLNFCWKYLVPFSLVHLLVTAVVLKI
ncbi:NADH dehydrogenase subunit H [Geoalkalibacter ferrihydriticus]|uniref:NADH-quinone oxidoreductase subunit H n=3 Tax=Geoalkalibacter ferrihydriticus TaxID=392333 RepID=A0A0C2HTL9_9BACT|nr:NADH:ubiquinone oxidoreductase subunit H [Geoalkalibacter ferrihydriticus DSM 17813]SDM45126.1 NADH dehydrogenase subunit H [Geoalkalibacter ferrihydriticus]